MIQKGWISYYWTGAIIQHALQTLFLALAVRWTFHRFVSRCPAFLPLTRTLQSLALGSIRLHDSPHP